MTTYNKMSMNHKKYLLQIKIIFLRIHQNTFKCKRKIINKWELKASKMNGRSKFHMKKWKIKMRKMKKKINIKETVMKMERMREDKKTKIFRRI